MFFKTYLDKTSSHAATWYLSFIIVEFENTDVYSSNLVHIKMEEC